MSELLPMDNTCPECRELVEQWDGSVDFMDGTTATCRNCELDLVAVAWTDGTMSLVKDESEPDPEDENDQSRTSRNPHP